MRPIARVSSVVLVVLAALAAFFALLAAGPAWGGTTQRFTQPQQAYAGSQARRVEVYVPDGLAGPAPLVMALHGCQQDEANVLREWGLKAAADRHGFILVAPFITKWDGLRSPNCWGFWLDGHRHQGRGEAEDLLRIAREVERRVAVRPRERYVLGLSSGAAMAVVQAVANGEYWAAAASAAGLPYGEDAASVSFGGCSGAPVFHDVARIAGDLRAERRDDTFAPPLLVLQNEADCTVRPTAAERLRDAHLRVYGSPGRDTPETALAGEAACTPVFGEGFGCRHARYTAASGRSVVETVRYRGPRATPFGGDLDHGHYWVGGADGVEGPYAVRRGPSYPEIAWDFFARHARSADPAPGPGPGPGPTPGCATRTDTPAGHLAAGRAVRGGFFWLRALSSGERAAIGWAFDASTAVTLVEGEPGRWYRTPPASCR